MILPLNGEAVATQTVVYYCLQRAKRGAWPPSHDMGASAPVWLLRELAEHHADRAADHPGRGGRGGLSGATVTRLDLRVGRGFQAERIGQFRLATPYSRAAFGFSCAASGFSPARFAPILTRSARPLNRRRNAGRIAARNAPEDSGSRCLASVRRRHRRISRGGCRRQTDRERRALPESLAFRADRPTVQLNQVLADR